MVKVFNGRRYDSSTAQQLGSYSNGTPYMDLNYLAETLYQKRTGEFFILGEGGAATKYAEPDGDMWVGGERIIPISVDGAKKWAEQHLTGEEYESIFGAVSDDDPSHMISATISAESYAKLKEMAARAQKSMSAIIDGLIKQA